MRAARDGERRGWLGLPLARTGGRQRPGAPRHDPVGVALPDVAEEQRAGAITCPGAGRGYRMQTTDHRGTPRKTMIVAPRLREDRPGAQAARRALAAGDDRRGATGRCPATGGVTCHCGADDQARLGARRHVYDAMPDDVRGGGDPRQAWLARRLRQWACRLGALPPMRMTASWFGSGWIHRIQGCGAMFRA